jgi:hypothetical protein
MSFTNIHRAAQAPLEDRIICLEWRPCDRNTLKGFAKIKVSPWHLIMDGVAVHERDGRSWAQLPARPQIDKETGQVVRDGAKIQYAKVLEFDDREVANRFSDAVVAAVKSKAAAR